MMQNHTMLTLSYLMFYWLTAALMLDSKGVAYTARSSSLISDVTNETYI